MHDIGMVHGDIKPANVLMRDEAYPLLSDYGCSLTLEQIGRVGVTTDRLLWEDLISIGRRGFADVCRKFGLSTGPSLAPLDSPTPSQGNESLTDAH